jgi:predicted dehydrogenase
VKRIAVAGLAHFHVQYVLDELAARPDMLDLVAMSDSDATNRQRWAGDFDGPFFDDDVRMIAECRPDIVAVFGVYADRARAIVAALDSGADVLVDKPMCTTLEQLEAIEQAAARSGRIVSTIYEKRWYPVTVAAKELVDSGALGDITLIAATAPHKLNADTRPEWFFREDGYGDIVADLPAHDIDLALLFTGAQAGTVSGWRSGDHSPEWPGWSDSCAVTMNLGSACATMEAHWLWPSTSEFHGHYRMRLTGTRGTAELDWALNTLTVVTDERPLYQAELLEAARPAAQAVGALLDGVEPEVSTAQSITIARIALLASRSAGSGAPEAWLTAR